MELQDVIRRVLGQHWRLILLFVVLGVAGAFLFHAGDVQTYTATTRVALNAKDPEDRSQSESIADIADAIATSPARVRDALRKAGAAGADPVETAKRDVSVEGLGTSGLVELSVRNPNPHTAAAVSDALAEEVIQTRSNLTGSQLDRAIGGVNRQITRLDRQIARLGAVRAETPQLTTRRDSLVQQRASLESGRVSALSGDSQRPKAAIVSPALVPVHADVSTRWPDMALGALLGLVLGIGLAALRETLRPTLVGRDALAKELNTPVLGELSSSDAEVDESRRTAEVGGRVGMAARGAGVGKVGLVPARPDLDLETLSEGLDAPLQVQPFDDFKHSTGTNGNRSGVVLVSPSTLKREELEEVTHLLRVCPGPLLGLITLDRRGEERRKHEAPHD